MNIYDEIRFKRLLAEKLLPVYMIFGEDDYLKKLYEGKIIKAAVGDNQDFNLHRFEAPEDLQRVYDAAAQLPMMSDYSCVAIRDYDIDKCRKDNFDRLISIVSGGFDTTVLVLTFLGVEIDYKKSDRAKKLIAAVEKAGGAVACLDNRRPQELIKLLCGGAVKRGCTMDSATAQYMISSVGQDINTLYSELEKLIGYAHANGGVITSQTVDEVCVRTVEASVYKIQDELLAGNAGRAVELIDRLFDGKIEATVILSTMASAYNEIYLVRAAAAAGKSMQEAASAFGYNNRKFVLERAQTSARRLNDKQLQDSLECLRSCDRAIKNYGSSYQQTAIERLAVELAGIAKNGGRP